MGIYVIEIWIWTLNMFIQANVIEMLSAKMAAIFFQGEMT